MKTFRIALAIMLAAMFSVFIGCGGGGGGSAPAPTTDSTATQTQAEPTPTVKVAGKVVIDGVDDYSGVVVVAEKSSSGVTARVQAMLDAATDEKEPGRISARAALNTPGVYTTETNSEGSYTFNIPEGKYSISAYKDNTLAATPRLVEATAGQTVTVDFELVATGSVSGTISIPSSLFSANLILAYLKGTSFAGYADDNGTYLISNVPVGTYDVEFSIGGQKSGSHSGISVLAGETTNNSLTSFTIACIDAVNCDDGNANTVDTCTNPVTEQAACSNAAIACSTDADCSDGNATTLDTCTNAGTSSASCSNVTVACFNDTDCDDSNAATTDTCVNPGTASAACSNVDGAPSAVTLNTPTNATTSSLDISWSQSSEVDFASYKVYYGTSTGVSQSSTLAQTVTTSTTTSATLTGLSENTTYFVKVYVCDAAGQCTTSNEANKRTLLTGTYISGGPMLSNTTWSLANSPYVLQGIVQVDTGVTLTIEPGVTIYYAGNYYIEIHGALSAVGTSGNPITLSSITGSSLATYGFAFTSDADLNLSNVSYVTIEYLGQAIVFNNSPGTITLSNMTISNNNSNVLSTFGECSMADAGGSVLIVGSNINIQNSTFSDNLGSEGGAICINGGSLSVSDCTFTGNGGGSYGGAIAVTTATTASITNSTFIDNTGDAQSSALVALTSTTITNCVFQNNNADVRAGTITNSTFTDSSLGYAYIPSTANISNSTFTSTSNSGTAITNVASITYNEISGYAIGVSGAPATFSNNNIHNNTSYNYQLSGASDVTVTNNWWGTTNTTDIEAKIYDRTEDLNLGNALYTPILPAAEPTAGDPD